MLIIMVFNTICHHFFCKRLKCVGVILRNEAMSRRDYLPGQRI